MNVYDFQEIERQAGTLKKYLADESLDTAMSNTLIKEQFSEFFYRQYGATLGAVSQTDDNMEHLFKTWCTLVSLPPAVWTGAWASIVK